MAYGWTATSNDQFDSRQGATFSCETDGLTLLESIATTVVAIGMYRWERFLQIESVHCERILELPHSIGATHVSNPQFSTVGGR